MFVLAVGAGACGSGTPSAAPTTSTTAASKLGTPTSATTPKPSTTTTSVPPTTAVPTTPPMTAPPTSAFPVALQPSAAQAAATLVSAWAGGNRPVALSVATPAAVNTLFAASYPSGNLVFRGCSTAFPPLVCSYGPPALGSGTLFEIYVSQASSGGWYVSSVAVET